MKKILYAIFLICLLSCKHDSEIPNIILDTDLGNSTDDLFAMQSVFYYRSLGQANLKGVIGSFKNNQAKRLLDCFMHYYKADDIPLGFIDGDDPSFFEMIPYCHLIDSTKADGTPLFSSTGIPISDRLPGWKLYRKLLSGAEDNSITILCTGIFTNIGLLLESGPDEYSPLSGEELVKKKVKVINLVGGIFTPIPIRYHDGTKSVDMLKVDYNTLGDIHSSKVIFEKWPTNMVIMPMEQGMFFPSDHDGILEKSKDQPDSPIYQVYSHFDEWKNGDVGQYLWDGVASLHAITGEKYFSCGLPCTITMDERGFTKFKTNPEAKSHIISVTEDNIPEICETLNKVIKFNPNK